MTFLLQERNHDTQTPHPAPPERPPHTRRLPLGLIAGAIGLALLVPLAGRAVDLFPSADTPVQEQVVDRSTPALLLALDDLTEYHAATGTFQTVIDRERDTPYVPSLISGERTSFLATGTVDALVDFSDVGAERVEVSADRRTVTISLPAAQLGQARVDPENSRVLDRDRGVVQRVGSMFGDNPSDEGELYSLAEDKLAAAAAESDLLDRAEENTRQMLTSLTRSLGFEQVTVTFEAAG